MDSLIFHIVVWEHYLLLRTPSLCFLRLRRPQGNAELRTQLQAQAQELRRGMNTQPYSQKDYVLLVPYSHSCRRIHIKHNLV